MRTYYYIIVIFLLVTLIYVYFDDNCKLEHFTQDEKKYCIDKRSSNYTEENNLKKNDVIDNSFCTYDKHIICDRPNATNYFTGNLIESEYNCPDKEAYNFEDYE